MKNNKKPNRTFIRIIKAFLFGMVAGMALLQYVRNKQRPVLALCSSECSDKIDDREEN
ncbi:MAG: hypothetical protein HDT46_11600 [Ruminococcaceae bacterium]|nr:hypothetical protein [Oscillospiraceae bacterium]